MINNGLSFKEGGVELLSLIQPLWEQLIVEHQHLSTYFPEHFAAMTFAKRQASLLEKNLDGSILIILVFDDLNSLPIAYAICTYSNNKVGELESIFVDPAYRGNLVGSQLVGRAITWLDSLGATGKVISVAVGNERVIHFYSRLGFFPRSIILHQKAAAN